MKKNIFLEKSSLFRKQSKKDWNKLNKTQKYFQIEDGKFDCIYFKDERKYSNTYCNNQNWEICVEIDLKTNKKANKDALNALKNGANSICFLNFNNHNLNIILDQIQFDILKINFKNIKTSLAKIVNQLIEIAVSRYGKNYKTKIQGFFHISHEDYKKFKDIISIINLQEKLPNYRLLNLEINKNNSMKEQFNNIEAIFQLMRNENYNSNFIISKDTIAKQLITFSYTLSNQFLYEISTLRAFRIAYEKKYKCTPIINCSINYNTSDDNSLIETCVKSIAAILGGTDMITIKYNEKNIQLYLMQQLILKYESNLHKVTDPLHGSYFIEYLTYHINNTKQNKIKIKKKNNFWQTFEGINIKSRYTKSTNKNIQHLNYGAGEPPFLRGPYSTMYSQKKWTIRQYSGFSTAEESNKFYKKNLKAGQTGLSIAFDLPTHRGYDSDNERVFGDVGKAGVAIDSIQDMETLFNGIDLSKTSVSMTMNGAIIPIMAFYIATAEKKGIKKEQLTGTIQNDILKEFMVRNTYIYPPAASMRIVRDIFKYTSQYMPKFNNISVSGYHMLEAGASADIELAYTLCDGLEYVRNGIQAGLKIDEFAHRLSFFWGVGMNFFMEIAKIRAARFLWSQMIAPFHPKNPKSLMLRSHCQTSGWSLTKQNPKNNITRTTIEALAAVMGGTQSLHTNALDEAIALPTNYTAKIARDTQLFLQNNTDICHAVDPFGGSYFIEKLTDELIHKAKKHITEIENMGGMVKAIEQGIPKLRIETSAIKRQTKIDSSENLIIGLNCFQNKEKTKIKILEIDNKKVQNNQIKKLTTIKKNRDNTLIKKALKNLQTACSNQDGNILELAIVAAKAQATLGEISNTLEKVFERYKAKTIINSGVYAMEKKNDKNFITAQKLTDEFKLINGRRPRILTTKIGQDGHDRGIKIIATSFADIGFDVDIAPLFQTPKEIVKQALENDVHIIGISSLAGGHKTLIPEIINLLKENNRNDIIVIAGGIIPELDYKYLKNKGVNKIFGSGTIVLDAAVEILNELLLKWK